jgi:hypothetical protein
MVGEAMRDGLDDDELEAKYLFQTSGEGQRHRVERRCGAGQRHVRMTAAGTSGGTPERIRDLPTVASAD